MYGHLMNRNPTDLPHKKAKSYHRYKNREVTVDPHQCYRINREDVVYESFENEVVIINLNSGNYYSFEGGGAQLWNLIKTRRSVGEMVESIVRRHDGICSDEIAKTINQSVAELEKEGLIVPDEPRERQLQSDIMEEARNYPTLAKSTFEKPVLKKYEDMQDFLLVDPIHEVDYTDWPKKKDSK
jgi:hypothetical protein